MEGDRAMLVYEGNMREMQELNDTPGSAAASPMLSDLDAPISDMSLSEMPNIHPITKAPVEILRTIFLETHIMLLDSQQASGNCSLYNGPWMLGQINRQWRDIVWSYPLLWYDISANLIITPEESATNAAMRIIRYICSIIHGLVRCGLGKETPLDVTLKLDRQFTCLEAVVEICAAIFGVTSRNIKWLNIEAGPLIWEIIESDHWQDRYPFDTLEWLDIRYTSNWPIDHVLSCFSKCNRLRRVSMYGFRFLRELQLQWENIDMLTVATNWHQFRTGNMLDDPFDIFRKMSNLVSLNLEGYISFDPHPSHPSTHRTSHKPQMEIIRLDKLQELYIAPQIIEVLDYLEVPNLQFISLAVLRRKAEQFLDLDWGHVYSVMDSCLRRSETLSSLTEIRFLIGMPLFESDFAYQLSHLFHESYMEGIQTLKIDLILEPSSYSSKERSDNVTEFLDIFYSNLTVSKFCGEHNADLMRKEFLVSSKRCPLPQLKKLGVYVTHTWSSLPLDLLSLSERNVLSGVLLEMLESRRTINNVLESNNLALDPSFEALVPLKEMTSTTLGIDIQDLHLSEENRERLCRLKEAGTNIEMIRK